ncbi:hypothetical protein LOTGIDRAFT_168666 [Lottia gigantea]|uniref:Uncharacterized protein n=1 Tax=Lottia gigantea TaxID=225164 RepID=V3ZUJ5_LOTGI|nr:hypothetical protein LOTGIDRAFT_168666 [Lottia gigantea]ESO84601.1 hypothetical protein LOTGIDRAFT_168666 [Lottia gigantea]
MAASNHQSVTTVDIHQVSNENCTQPSRNRLHSAKRSDDNESMVYDDRKRETTIRKMLLTRLKEEMDNLERTVTAGVGEKLSKGLEKEIMEVRTEFNDKLAAIENNLATHQEVTSRH